MQINATSITLALLILCMSFLYKSYTAFTTAGKSTINNIKNTIMADYDHFVFKKSEKPLPIFFFSHGGPTFQERASEHPGAWDMTKKVGRYITKEVKPDFIIVVSAHWQTGAPDEIEVSIPGPGEARFTQNRVVSNKLRADENALVYDFYGFPQRFYDSQFHTVANKFIADDIVKTLKASDWFQAKTTERGIDHGVFVPGKVAFADPNVIDSGKLDVDVPVIQVSLAGTSDIEIHYRLGEALSRYRDLNGAIIFSGMSVHNLRDYRFDLGGGKKALPYVEPFNKILTNILTDPNHDAVLENLKQLPRKPEWKDLYHKAHPTNEHLLPAVVGAGAARGDECKLLFTDSTDSLGWNLYSWGNTNGKL